MYWNGMISLFFCPLCVSEILHILCGLGTQFETFQTALHSFVDIGKDEGVVVQEIMMEAQ